MKLLKTLLLASIAALMASCCGPEKPEDTDGHQLWFYSMDRDGMNLSPEKTTMAIAANEIDEYWKGGQKVSFNVLESKDESLGSEGYRLTFGKDGIAIDANTETGVLYGTYDLLRRQETGKVMESGTVTEVPAYQYRVLNHWDNPDLTVERGYAGKSLWKWESLPGTILPVYEEYARANASLGINCTVLNNVNADPVILTPEYLEKVKALADIFRPYGLKVFLSINFASPKRIGGLKTSDPLDKDVTEWWNEKAAEIYALIPDFGGFLVKANSEGQSGPQDYGRTHADGANMLAKAVEPFGGIVMWRAFVYDPQASDRAMQASLEFVPFDGKFRDNVIIQIKNGPIDFQPREPFSPLFGQLENTTVMAEMQITQEYLGHSNHLVYLHPMWKECLDADTYQKGEGSTVREITTGKLHNRPINAIAGVTNIGDSTNWCGHHFAQANWYAFGRMAWDPELSSEQIADEWIRQTFTGDADFVDPVKALMLESRENTVRYEMPLGLHHTFSSEGHYGPGPWEGSIRPDWSPKYYHKAGPDGVGFDRTMNGSGNTGQYNEPVASVYGNVETCPEDLILWFHHLPWDYRMKSGETLWDTLCHTFQDGIDAAAGYLDTWASVRGFVDEQRWNEVNVKLVRQAKDALWWRDATMLYFQTFSNLPIPEDCSEPQYTLEQLQKVRLNITNFETPDPEILPEYDLNRL